IPPEGGSYRIQREESVASPLTLVVSAFRRKRRFVYNPLRPERRLNGPGLDMLQVWHYATYVTPRPGRRNGAAHREADPPRAGNHGRDLRAGRTGLGGRNPGAPDGSAELLCRPDDARAARGQGVPPASRGGAAPHLRADDVPRQRAAQGPPEAGQRLFRRV